MTNLLIVDGKKAIKEYQKELRRIVKEHKEIYKGWGYTYKAVRPKNAKRPYYYWYKWEYDTDTQNNIWTYVGKDKPEVDIPDPPTNRLHHVTYSEAGENVIITEEELEKVADIFEGYQKFQIQSV